MTKISLTNDLKKQALQQYHPYVNIGLWSLEQEEFENANYNFKNIKSFILKDTLFNLFNEENAQFTVIKIIPDSPSTFTIDKSNLHTNTGYRSLTFNIDDIPDKMYFMCTQVDSFSFIISYYKNNTTLIGVESLDFNPEKQYNKYIMYKEYIQDIFDEDSTNTSFDSLSKITIEIPTHISYLGTQNSNIILDNDTYIQLETNNMPKKIYFTSSTSGHQNIQVMFYRQNPMHPLTLDEVTTEVLSIEILDEVDRDNLPIIQNDTVNLKILEKDIESLLLSSSCSKYKEFINDDYSNVIFTPENDLDTIIPYEYHNGVFYLELPKFYRTISLHLITKYFDASDDVILLNTNDIIDIITTNESEIWHHNSNVSRSNDKINILANDTEYGYYIIPLPSYIASLDNIEIDTFINYTTNDYGISRIGILDTNPRTNTNATLSKEQKSLICEKHYINGAVYDNIIGMRKSQNGGIATYNYENMPTLTLQGTSFTKHENLCKYINDALYIEEYNPYTISSSDVTGRITGLKTNNKYNYIIQEWPFDND